MSQVPQLAIGTSDNDKVKAEVESIKAWYGSYKGEQPIEIVSELYDYWQDADEKYLFTTTVDEILEHDKPYDWLIMQKEIHKKS